MIAMVNRKLCIGCGLCAEICPEVFQMGDDMIAKVMVSEIILENIDSAQEAASACPVEAIAVTE